MHRRNSIQCERCKSPPYLTRIHACKHPAFIHGTHSRRCGYEQLRSSDGQSRGALEIIQVAVRNHLRASTRRCRLQYCLLSAFESAPLPCLLANGRVRRDAIHQAVERGLSSTDVLHLTVAQSQGSIHRELRCALTEARSTEVRSKQSNSSVHASTWQHVFMLNARCVINAFKYFKFMGAIPRFSRL